LDFLRENLASVLEAARQYQKPAGAETETIATDGGGSAAQRMNGALGVLLRDLCSRSSIRVYYNQRVVIESHPEYQ
jgi:hypothetical protein